MRLARKLTLGLILGIAAVMSASAYLRIQREAALFETDQGRDQRTMGRALRAAVIAVWRADGEARAQSLIQGADSNESEMQISWLWLDALDESFPSHPLSPSHRQSLAHGRAVTFLHTDGTGAERRSTLVPVPIVGERAFALVVSESLSSQRTYIWTSVLQIMLATAVIIGICGVIATGLGFWFVGRPIGRLSEKARRVGAGDFSGRLDLQQKDEIGELATEIDAMCERLGEAHQRLASETEHKITALEQLRHADRLKTVGQLAAGLAHELGTPLNVILGRARMIARRAADSDVLGNIHIIEEQASRMTGIIRQLLDLSRRRAQRLAVSDLRRLVNQTLAMLSTITDKRGVTVVLKADGDRPIKARVDQSQFQQALTNVLLNGIQAMPDGGSLHIRLGHHRTRPPQTRASQEADAEYLYVTVQDEGTGIPSEHISHVFEPFFTTKGVGEGTGLGLSVAYGIARDHGGWIDVESTSGMGSRFTIHLPARWPEPTDAQEER